MKIIIAIVIFSAIILFHELGHFLFAKLNKIVVTEFSLGMGPRLYSFEKGDTRYSLKLLPIGGSCAMLGEDTDIENEPGTFNSASVWGRISVVAAGPVFNFIMAFVLSVIIVGAVGYEPSRVLSVKEGSAAEAAGLKEGDIITGYQGYHIDLGKDLYVYSYLNQLKEGDTINLTVKRDGKKMDISYKSDTNVRYLLGCNFNGDDTSAMTVESVMDGMPLQEAGIQQGDVITSINGVKITNAADYQKYIQENPLTEKSVKITYSRDGQEYDITVTPKEYRTAESGFTYNMYSEKAKGLNKIVVTEFSLGMGPRLFSFEKGDTRYSLKLLPIGGSCAMLGEDTDIENEPGTFNSASVWGRISVVAAGPVFNFIMAFVLSVIIVGAVGYEPSRVLSVKEGSAAEAAGLKEGDIITGYQGYHIDLGKDLYVYSYLNQLKEGDTINLTVKRDGKKMDISYKSDTNVRYLLGCNFNGDDTSAMTVESVMDGMPLQEAGIQQGDVITSINGVKITNAADYQKYIQENPLTEKSVKITYSRDGQEYDITVTPKEYRTAESGFTYNMYSEKAKGLNIVKYGAVEVKYMVRTTILSLKELVSGKLGMKDLSGPVGIVDAIGTTYEESKSEGTMILWMNMLNLAVLLSANLGVMNLLPFPALDGGRLVFLVIEAIRRKPINRQVEGGIHFAGLMLLMALMVFVMYNDIVKLI